MDSFKKIKFRLQQIQKLPAFFWLSLLLLNAIILLPAVIFAPGSFKILPIPPVHGPRGGYDFVLFFFRRDTHDLFRIVVEFYLMVTILFLVRNERRHIRLRRVFIGIYFFLLIYHTYDAAMFYFFDQQPVLYNDIKLLLGGLYLIVDFSYSHLISISILIITGVLFLLWFIPLLFGAVSYGLRQRQYSKPLILGGAAVWVFILSMTWWFPFRDYRPVVRWVLPRLAINLQHSWQIRNFVHSIKDQPVDSTYYQFDKLSLQNPPDIHLIMIESYGKVLQDNAEVQPRFKQLMQETEQVLGQNGRWHMASNYSESPISGGRSWLSIATVLTGVHIQDQAVYSYLINQARQYPHLVRFLNNMGYSTVTLQPMKRQSPGFSLTNY
ncbi:MAG: hypothetical protein WAN36_09350 [Calditrichia bacterium]